MVVYKRLIRNRVAFTEDTDDILIVQPRYIHAIDVGLEVLQNGATAPSLSDILSVINKVQVKLSGRITTEMSGQDLLAYNVLVDGREPLYLVPANDNELGYVSGLRIPMALPTGEHVLAIRFLHTSVATVDTEKLTMATLEYPEAIERAHYEIPTFSFTPPSTGAFNTAVDTTYGGALHGFLIYSPTIPTATSDTATVREVRVYVDGEMTFEGTIHDLRSEARYPADATLRSITDNYIYIDFSKAPIEAGRRIELQIKSDDTNEIRILPIIRVA